MAERTISRPWPAASQGATPPWNRPNQAPAPSSGDRSSISFLKTPSAKLGSDLRVTSDGLSSTTPALSWTGSEDGVGWQDNRDGNNEIYFARISAAGANLGSDLRVTSQASDDASPNLAWTGSEFGLSWQTNRDGNYEIYFARIAQVCP